MKTIAIFPGTFDPITFGHLDIVKRAALLFDKIIVAVAASQRKVPLFSLSQRLDLAKAVFKDQHNVEVSSFEGLAIDLAKQCKAQVLLRGVRTILDMEFEFQMASMNRNLCPEIETIFLAPQEKYAYVSSTIIREIASMGGDVSSFVPEPVVKAFEKMRSS